MICNYANVRAGRHRSGLRREQIKPKRNNREHHRWYRRAKRSEGERSGRAHGRCRYLAETEIPLAMLGTSHRERRDRVRPIMLRCTCGSRRRRAR
jgi:hypothetical protein